MWNSMESVNGLAAVRATWRKHLGDRFETLAGVFMRQCEHRATHVPCQMCSCSHRVTEWRGELTAVCDCDYDCDNIKVVPDDLVIWNVNQKRLGRAVTSALGIESVDAGFELQHTRQIGAFGPERVPVVLCLAQSPEDVRQATSEMSLRIRDKFILLAPTGRFLNARVKEALALARSEFMALDGVVSVLPSGALHAQRSAGELFSHMLPQQRDGLSDASARGLFALVKQLDSEQPVRKAPIVQVFRLYCVEGLTRAEVARRCGCVESLVTLRLQAIEAKLGRKPSELRMISSHFERIEDSLKDDRAREIYLRGAAEIEEEQQ